MHIWQTIREAFVPAKSDIKDPCFWRVDIHSHLLPGVDDGVSTTEQAVACLTQLSQWGIRKVITTPHVSRDWHPNESFVLRGGQQLLQNLADEHELGLTIEVAAEYLLDEFFIELLNAGDLLTFGRERYLLFELGWAAAPRQLDDILFRMQARGYKPVLAHPERYLYYYNALPALAQLRANGCLFQLNWGSLTRRYGERVQTQANMFLRHNWVDFFGSDMHRSGDITTMNSLFTSPYYSQLKRQSLLNESLI
ncbi:tyrosine-protein phosphatase [Spirosoma montaniterrae]|uniref:protein-tyrosine-phosphatase n=1 Tax=Spirosoma montaniterrae TaxID=1178516 RepID=A0A1P9X184_9BACT|nr:CpsB/CapC family capsule biosynthesis tyrosine phosphatase [Spirosoma montaniterrae]AQG81390.1 histidinol-phosphatase [Spirosoma montaniterrae]